MSVAHGQRGAFGEGREGGAVENRAIALVEFLHRHDVLALDAFGQVGEEGSHFVECELTHGDGGDGLGHCRHAALGVLGHHLAQGVVLGGDAALFVDGRVVVVAGHVGSEAGGVGAGPVSEARSAVGHIEAE